MPEFWFEKITDVIQNESNKIVENISQQLQQMQMKKTTHKQSKQSILNFSNESNQQSQNQTQNTISTKQMIEKWKSETITELFEVWFLFVFCEFFYENKTV